MTLHPYGDNIAPVIPVDHIEHVPERPFCLSDDCPCREDTDAINELNDAYQNGLASRADVDRIYHGRTV